MNLPLEIDAYKKPDLSHYGDVLNATPIIEPILLKIHTILEQNHIKDDNLHSLSRELYTRAVMLDTCFNPIFPSGSSLQPIDEEILDWVEMMLQDEEAPERLPNQIYPHTPAIGVYLSGVPLLLSYNYLEVIGASNVFDLKNELTEGSAWEKYYDLESSLKLKSLIKTLPLGTCEKHIILTTKEGKKIEWQICRLSNMIEIQIGREIPDECIPQTVSVPSNGFSKTPTLIKEYREKVKKLIGNFHTLDDGALHAFEILAMVLDKIWTNGYYLMQIIKKETSEVIEQNQQWTKNQNSYFCVEDPLQTPSTPHFQTEITHPILGVERIFMIAGTLKMKE